MRGRIHDRSVQSGAAEVAPEKWIARHDGDCIAGGGDIAVLVHADACLRELVRLAEGDPPELSAVALRDQMPPM
jgi:hypothetical protein